MPTIQELVGARGAVAPSVRLVSSVSPSDWASSVEVVLKSMPCKTKLWEQASCYYRKNRARNPKAFEVSDGIGDVRWASLVAYVRHAYSNYDDQLAVIDATMGYEAAYPLLRTRYDTVIHQYLFYDRAMNKTLNGKRRQG
jgi:hypothetical protein